MKYDFELTKKKVFVEEFSHEDIQLKNTLYLHWLIQDF